MARGQSIEHELELHGLIDESSIQEHLKEYNADYEAAQVSISLPSLHVEIAQCD